MTRTPATRRGFNLVELLIALSITATLLMATMVAIRASFMAYQSTTEVASTNTIARLAMNRMLTLIRTGWDFGPFPADPNNMLVESNEMWVVMPEGDTRITMTWVPDPPADPYLFGNALYYTPATYDSGADAWINDTPQLILEGVVEGAVPPFTLEFLSGRQLYRATIDLTIVPDDNMSMTIDGENSQQIRLVASSGPRITSYK